MEAYYPLAVEDRKTAFFRTPANMPGISPKMLTKQLRELEEDGLILREVYPEIPPKVEYSLTEFGKTVFPVLDALSRWGIEYLGRECVLDKR
jgi:DNA-binding HxlR family transcriptional regulator